ncbi:terpenoid cyclases/Protein prenyltransferase [Morchella conica CCBAS932]|uniref:Protein farnesyltransferase subunit beta n=1 Tax=Morchella conica CCBAS932 TaxID=1392247 RepID=A0A3N4L9X1_9PEZI|nr:terpenoid cyclases/Protein prenyltransferase [Morchella conica CCBAS932]
MASSSSSPSSSTNPPTPVENLNTILDNLRVQELSSSDTSEPASSPAAAESYYPYNPSNPYIPPAPPAPALFTTLPLLRDALTTRSSVDQDATVNSCIRYLGYPEDPFPILDRENHIAFLESGLTSKLPDYMVAYDASRAWLVYWCLSGLASLGVDLAKYRARVMDTLRPLQNAEGGFGGGNGQMSHITATYAAVLALCLVSPRPTAATTPNDNDKEEEEDKEAEETPLDLIDRRAMLKYLHSVKVPETGGFRVAINGESDVRGCYCALVIITLLGLPTSNGLVRGTRGYLSRCQTFEGGFGATPDGNEAHGGYAFCALAALCMLGEPREVMTSSLDMGRLIAWLSARQYAPEGGLSGRTNKLVDGCYSTWVGGCWPLVEAACNGPQKPGELVGGVVGSLWSREGLARYILACCQNMKGGMRDKPNKAPDFYHTCYVLLGLSSAQHYSYYTPSPETLPASAPLAGEEGENEDLPLRSAFTWRVSERIPSVVKGVYEPVVEDIPTWPDDVAEEGAVGDRLKPHHPIFNIPLECVEAAERWVAGRVGF